MYMCMKDKVWLKKLYNQVLKLFFLINTKILLSTLANMLNYLENRNDYSNKNLIINVKINTDSLGSRVENTDT